MKTIFRYIFLTLFTAFGFLVVSGQEYDLNFSSPESGTLVHQTRNSITLLPGYTYAPNGNSLLLQIVNPAVTGIEIYPNQTTDAANRTLNTSYLVGTTPDSFNVNPLGGATYTIPIDVLPGVNSLAPSLSLVYSSNSGPGVAGYGWQIGGISAISRTGQNYYNDGATSGVDLTANDRFMLDGQRLVPTSGTYGANGMIYRTETDIFTRVQSVDSLGTGPEKFTAQTKSGIKNYYGQADDGKQKLDGYAEVINWFVTETQDLYGNSITYKYLKDNNVVYIGEIAYGPNKITFNYLVRLDATTSYFKGKKMVQQLLLDKITVSYNENVVKTYQMRYNYQSNDYNGYSLLNEVIEYGTGGTRLNSTVFNYQSPAPVSFQQTLYNTNNQLVNKSSRMCTGDFNGDGKVDFLCLPDANLGATWTGMKICFGDGNDNFQSVVSISNNIDLNKLDDMEALDINGDGKDDLVYEIANSGSSMFYFMLSNGTSLDQPVIIPDAQITNGYTGIIGKDRRKNSRQENDNQFSGSDFDGDGKNEIFLNDPNGQWRMVVPTNDRTRVAVKYSGSISSLSGRTLCADFDGDGKAEVWSIEDSGINIYSLTFKSGRRYLLELKYSSNWPTKNHFFTLGDFNGDGKADIFLYGYKNGSNEYDWSDWQIQLSTGTGFEGKTIYRKKSNLKNDYVRLGDFNGDGCTDLKVIPTDNSWSGCYYFICKNKGQNFTAMYNNYSNQYNNLHCYFADFNGDGRTDFVETGAQDYQYTGYQVYKSTGNTTPLLEKISNGLNHLTSISYTKLSQAPASVYQLGSASPVFPVSNFSGPIPVVSAVAADNGIGGTNTLTYCYEGAKIHRQGKGFLGYSKTKVTDVASGMVNETLTDVNTTYFYPQVTTVTQKTTGGVTLGLTANTWTQTVLDDNTKRIFPYISTSAQTNALTGQTVTTTVSGYDNYGNPQSVTKTFKTGTTDEGSQTVSYLYQSENTDSWLLGRPTRITTSFSRGGETLSQVVNREFSATTNLDTAQVNYPGTDKEVRFSKVCYPNGNLRKQIAKTGGVSRVTSYVYTADNVRVYSSTDPLKHTTTRAYYPTTGLLQTEADYLGNTVAYTYDALGRALTKSQSDGFVATTTYNWGVGTFANSVYNLTSSGNDGSESKTWYDKLGREIRSDAKGFNGQYIYTVTNYKPDGKVQQVSEPSASTSPAQWAKYEYYPEGRLKKVERHTGSVTNYTYSSNRATVDTDGKVRWSETDSQGLLSKAHDNGGDITYAYYPDGKVKSITSPDGAVTSMEYNDGARNQTRLTDPSAGTMGYVYDGFGQITNQTNARGQTNSTRYLADGRLDYVDTPEGRTSYTYNANLQISGVGNSTSGVSRAYTYDTKGRVTGIAETIAGSTFSTTFTFDGLGRPKTRTHPSGITETTGYNSYGYFSSVSVDNGATKIYEVTGMNERSQLTNATYGGILTSTLEFDTYGYPKRATTGSVQDYGYSFDAVTSNLNWRKNYLKNLTESFGYTDGLDRLNTVTGPQNLAMTYAANGNIRLKTDVHPTAEFSYGLNAGPYALTGLTATATVIPALTQNAAYTSFEKVNTLNEGTVTATFVYNPDNQRAKMDVTQNGASLLARWYAGSSYMKETASGVTKEYTYLGGDAYSAPVVAVKQNGTNTYYYLLRDYLGNLTHTVNASTNAAQEYSFDAWGRRRNPANWSYTLTSEPELLAWRGFTGHEYLPYFNLYNMNGRMYDPLVARFLNVDPYVQMPDYTQNLNRYSYCINNPLKYTDKNGEWFGIDDAVAFIIGGAVNLTVNLIQGNIDNVGEGLAAFGAGGAAGTLALYGPAGWAAGGAIVGGTNAWVSGAQGWDILQGAGIGVFSGLAGGAVGQWAAQGLGNVVVQGLNITSPVLKGVVGGTIGGAAGGYAGGFTGGLLTTGDLSAAHQAGMSGMTTGAPIGGLTGGIGAYAYAKSHNINPWSGKYNKSVVIGRQMESRVNPVAGDLGAETITNAWNEQFGEGVRVSDSKGIQFNRRWYSGKLNDGYHVYDIGSGGLPSGKYYGAELSLSKGYWNVSKTNYWSFFNNNIRIIYYGK